MLTFDVRDIAVLEVGALIFVLGIDSVKEAVWDTRRRNPYIPASLFFVLQNSRGSAIRSSFTVSLAVSCQRVDMLI